jgi:hypothetical protein
LTSGLFSRLKTTQVLDVLLLVGSTIVYKVDAKDGNVIHQGRAGKPVRKKAQKRGIESPSWRSLTNIKYGAVGREKKKKRKRALV